jgi:hypothetical protein
MKTKNQTKSIFRLGVYAIKLSLCLAVLYFLNSCAPCYYAPSAHNVPLLQEKKDFRASGAVKFGNRTIGYDFQGAVAASNHIGIMLNYSHYSGRKSLLDETNLTNSKSNMVEIGAGYFLPFGEKFVFETFAGYGTAKVKSTHDSYLDYKGSEVHSWSLFLQPTVGMHQKHVELAFSTRFRMLDFNNVEFMQYQGGQPDESLANLENAPMSFFVEPAFTFRAGGEKIKYQLQVGFAAPLSENNVPDFDPFNLNMGLIFSLKGKKEM